MYVGINRISELINDSAVLEEMKKLCYSNPPIREIGAVTSFGVVKSYL